MVVLNWIIIREKVCCYFHQEIGNKNNSSFSKLFDKDTKKDYGDREYRSNPRATLCVSSQVNNLFFIYRFELYLKKKKKIRSDVQWGLLIIISF